MGRRPLLPYEITPIGTQPPRPTPPLTQIVLSDTAWHTLTQRAITGGYVRKESSYPRGMIYYLQALTNPAQEWTDTRPDYLVELSTKLVDPAFDNQRRKYHEGSVTSLFSPELPLAERLTGPHHPIWWDPDLDGVRRKRTFILSQFPFTYYSMLALRFMIGDPYSSTFKTSVKTLAANAVEAIGRGSLTPSIEPINAHPPKSPPSRKRPVEIQW